MHKNANEYKVTCVLGNVRWKIHLNVSEMVWVSKIPAVFIVVDIVSDTIYNVYDCFQSLLIAFFTETRGRDDILLFVSDTSERKNSHKQQSLTKPSDSALEVRLCCNFTSVL